jgi:hypothetical protein
LLAELSAITALFDSVRLAGNFPSPVACLALEDQLRAHWRDGASPIVLSLAHAVAGIRALDGNESPHDVQLATILFWSRATNTKTDPTVRG